MQVPKKHQSDPRKPKSKARGLKNQLVNRAKEIQLESEISRSNSHASNRSGDEDVRMSDNPNTTHTNTHRSTTPEIELKLTKQQQSFGNYAKKAEMEDPDE